MSTDRIDLDGTRVDGTRGDASHPDGSHVGGTHPDGSHAEGSHAATGISRAATPDTVPVSYALALADRRLSSGVQRRQTWATGFGALDTALHGGFRAGDLVLLAGPQGLGKTTWVLQTARNVARAGKPALMISYEHDVESLVMRLLALEAGEHAGSTAASYGHIQQAFEGLDGTVAGLTERLARLRGGAEAQRALAAYADRLVILPASGMTTGFDQIVPAIEEVRQTLGEPPVVFVDYLQKIPAPQFLEEAERVTHVVETLKDLAMELRVPIMSVVAHDKDGLEAGKRLRARHMRGSSALAYEADVLLLMNLKYDVVARHHLVYDLNRAEGFKDWVVLTLEKNRAGQSGVELEFRKRLHQSRFEPDGGVVTEQLVGDRVLTE
ncbi:MAG TPA: DnaB-like helicase C-terminal domain-containing protein [Marmoricola sp.]|nr:DnaB-like helicase C-terminal domain-containing protein [Marmoricola sp.]